MTQYLCLDNIYFVTIRVLKEWTISNSLLIFSGSSSYLPLSFYNISPLHARSKTTSQTVMSLPSTSPLFLSLTKNILVVEIPYIFEYSSASKLKCSETLLDNPLQCFYALDFLEISSNGGSASLPTLFSSLTYFGKFVVIKDLNTLLTAIKAANPTGLVFPINIQIEDLPSPENEGNISDFQVFIYNIDSKGKPILVFVFLM